MATIAINLDLLLPYHLKTRIAITVSLLTLGFMALLSWLALSYFEEQFKAATFAKSRSKLRGIKPKFWFKISLSGETAAYVDCGKMTQVLDNLISNAVKYSPQGGEIEIRSVRLNGLLRIDIEDHGSGMSAGQVERVFDKFYRADSSDTAVSGLGLGMSIVKVIIEGHGGRIWVESSVGKGTCVSLELPLSGTTST